MIGEQIAEGRGHRTARRVVCTEPHFKVEVSFEDATKLLGVEGVNIATYVSTTKPDGSLHGEGEGVFATLEGDLVTWKAIGVGHFGAAGSTSYKGSISYKTLSSKLARLNGLAGVFEFDADASGNTHSKIWEMK